MAQSELRTDWASHPGDTIRRVAATRGLDVRELGHAAGQDAMRVRKVIQGDGAVDSSMARLLETLLGVSARFWLARQQQYDATYARLQEEQAWYSSLPIRDMVRYGWLDQPKSAHSGVRHALKYFDVPTVSAWRTSYDYVLSNASFKTSKTYSSDAAAVAAWLREGHRRADSLACEPWDESRLRDSLPELRTLTREKDPERFIPAFQQICAASGVAVIPVRAPKGCRASGATMWPTKSKAVVLLSFRYLSDDQFWFAFFHELGHVLLHGHTPTLEVKGSNDVREREADSFAAETLVPTELRPKMRRLGANRKAIIRFALDAGISPGIVVGQLQHEGRLNWRQMNGLKRRYQWV